MRWEKWQETDLKNITEEKSIGPSGWFNSGGVSGDSGQLEKKWRKVRNIHIGETIQQGKEEI